MEPAPYPGFQAGWGAAQHVQHGPGTLRSTLSWEAVDGSGMAAGAAAVRGHPLRACAPAKMGRAAAAGMVMGSQPSESSQPEAAPVKQVML